MKQVSNAYKDSMKSILRGRSHIKIAFSNVDTTAPADGEWVSNGAQSYSEFNTVDYSYDYQETYGTLELNRWALDGTSIITPDSEPKYDGFISSIITDEHGNVATSTLNRAFSNPHTFSGLTLTFDTRTHEWADIVIADFYYEGEIVETVTAKCDGETLIIDAKVLSCDKIVLTMNTILPYRRVRLQSILYGVMKEFTNDDIVSTKQSHDVDPLSRRLPKENFQFTLIDFEHNYDPDNAQGIYTYLDTKSPVSIRFGYELPSGDVEWVKADKYLLTSKPTVSNNQATFTGTGLIGTLTNTFYKSRTGSKNLYDMAEEVLLDADLTLTEQGTNPWVIDESLKEMYTTAVLPIDTHANCLQLIAHASRSRLFTDDDNVIHIKPFGVTVKGIYSGTWSDNGHVWFNDWETVDYGDSSGTSFATLELNRWVLNTNQIVLPDTNAIGKGYASDVLTNSNGDYSTPPVLVKRFDVSHDLPVLVLDFDSVLNEFPQEVEVQYFKGAELLDIQTVCDIKSHEIYVSSNLAIDCTSIQITIRGGLPHHRARLGRVYTRETDFMLDFTSIREKSQKISKIDKLKEVTVAKYDYTCENESRTLYETDTVETSLHVEFSNLAQDVVVTVSNDALISANVYGRACDLVLAEGLKHILITGKSLSENSVITTYPVALDGETDEEKNPLITNDDMSNALANHVKKYLTLQNTYDCTYRGNPEMEVGDIIGMETNYTDNMDGLILVDEIDYNGSLSGKMKVKGLI